MSAKIHCQFHWDSEKKIISIVNKPLLLEQLSERRTCFLDAELEDEFTGKSAEARAYFFSEVAVKAQMAYKSLGYSVKDKYMAYNLLCLDEDIDCTDKILNKDGDVAARVPKRFSKLGQKELAYFTNECIMLIESLGFQVEDAETWKARRKNPDSV